MLRQDSSNSCSDNIDDVKNCNSNKILKYFNKLKNTKVFNELDPIAENNNADIPKSLINDDKSDKYMGNILLSSVDSMEELNNNIDLNVKSIEYTEISETYSSCSSSEFTFNSGNNETHKTEKIDIYQNSIIKKNDEKNNTIKDEKIEDNKPKNNIANNENKINDNEQIKDDLIKNKTEINETKLKNSDESVLIKNKQENTEVNNTITESIKEKNENNTIVNKSSDNENKNSIKSNIENTENLKNEEVKKNKAQNEKLKKKRLINKINNELAKDEKKEQLKNINEKSNDISEENKADESNSNSLNSKQNNDNKVKAKKKNTVKNVKIDKKLNNNTSKKNKKSNTNNSDDIKMDTDEENSKDKENKNSNDDYKTSTKNDEKEQGEKMDIDQQVDEEKSHLNGNINSTQNDNTFNQINQPYVNTDNKMNTFNCQDKQYLNYQFPQNTYSYINGSMNDNVNMTSLYNNGQRPNLATVNLYDPSIYENNTYSNNVPSSMNPFYSMKKEDEILNSMGMNTINDDKGKNGDMAKKYTDINKVYSLNQNLPNDYYGNPSTPYINNSLFTPNSLDLLYNDYNSQLASSRSSIKSSEDNLVKDDVDKWVKFPLENDMSNISSLVYMINKDNKSKSKENLNSEKSTTSNANITLNENSMEYLSNDMEYMYKMKKDVTMKLENPKSKQFSKDELGSFNSQKNEEVDYNNMQTLNDNSLSSDMKRKRGVKYPYEDEINNSYRPSSQIIINNNPQIVQQPYNMQLNSYPMNYPVSMIQKNYIHPSKRQKIPVKKPMTMYNTQIKYNDSNMNNQKTESNTQNIRQPAYYQSKKHNDMYTNPQPQYNSYYHYNSYQKYNYPQNANQNTNMNSYHQTNYRDPNNKSQMVMANQLSPNSSSISLSSVSNMNSSSNYQIMMTQYQNNRNMHQNQNPYITPNPSLSMSNSSSSSNLLSCDSGYINQNGNNNLRMKLQRKLIMRLQQKEEGKGFKQEVPYVQNDNKMRMNNNYMYNNSYENINAQVTNINNCNKYYNRDQPMMNNKYKYAYDNSMPNEVSAERMNYKGNEMIGMVNKTDQYEYSQSNNKIEIENKTLVPKVGSEDQINTNISITNSKNENSTLDNKMVKNDTFNPINEMQNSNTITDEKSKESNLVINPSKVSDDSKNDTNNKETKNNDDEKSEKKNDVPNNQYLNKSNIIEFNPNRDPSINVLNNKYDQKNPENTYNNNINNNNNNLYFINNMYTMNNDKSVNNSDSNMMIFNPNESINSTKSTDGSAFNSTDNLPGNSQSKDTIRDNIQKRLRMRMMVKDKNYNPSIPGNPENTEQYKIINSSQLMPIDSIPKNSLSQDIPMNLNDQINSFQMYMIDNEFLELNTSLTIENDKNLDVEKEINNENYENNIEEKNNEKNEIKNIELKETEVEKQPKTLTQDINNNETIENNSDMKEFEMKESEIEKSEIKKSEIKKSEMKESEIKESEMKKSEIKESEMKETEKKESEMKESDLNKSEVKESEKKESTELNDTNNDNESVKESRMEEEKKEEDNNINNISDYINLSPHLGESISQSFLFDSTSNNEIISNPECFINFSYPLSNQIEKKNPIIDNTTQADNDLTQNNDLLYTNDNDWYSNNDDYFSKLTTENDVNSTLTSDEIKNLWINPQ